MATTAVIGLSTGKRLLSSSFICSDLSEKFSLSDHLVAHYQYSPGKNVITAKKTTNYSSSLSSSSSSSSNRQSQSVNALKECLDTVSAPSGPELWFDETEVESSELEDSVDAVLLLQKSMLEKQWNLSAEKKVLSGKAKEKTRKKMSVVCSRTSARQRRLSNRKNLKGTDSSLVLASIFKDLHLNSYKGYGKGTLSKKFLSHAEVVFLSKMVQAGISIENHKSSMQERLGYEPTDQQLATSLDISNYELQTKLLDSYRAREKLAQNNVRLVISIAKKYENKGSPMADLVQGGLAGLMRGIEKFDPSKGCRFTTYAYWWILQGVKKAYIETSRVMTLPAYMHTRLGLIKKAKIKLEEQNVDPTIENIATFLNMTERKVRNASRVVSKVYSFDRDPFHSLNGSPGPTYHSYIADPNPDNNPWLKIAKDELKDKVNSLMNKVLNEREREIIRLYYGFNKQQSLTWEEISKRMGISRERARQIGLISLRKLKIIAKKRKLYQYMLETVE
uniref:Sigma factor n=1 Tax=Pelargonium tetragonum TaxID=122197 RepID=A0A0G2SUC7_9ROSI|nr:sigma factor [Pelargonium tetragonum]